MIGPATMRRDSINERTEPARRVLSAFRRAINSVLRNPADSAQAKRVSTNPYENRNVICYGVDVAGSLPAHSRPPVECLPQVGYGSESTVRAIPFLLEARPSRTVVPSAIDIPYSDPASKSAERQP